MPKIVVWRDPERVELLVAFSDRLAAQLSKLVADSIGCPSDWVEVVFVPVEKTVNAAPLNIEITYSVTDRLHPAQSVTNFLARNIVKMVQEMSDLPPGVTEITCWIMPQTDTFFYSEETDPPQQ